jgi:hypothetical protein
MSIVKIDLSLSSIDRNELYAVIDCKALLDTFEVSDINKLLEAKEDLVWTGEAEDYLTEELGFVVVASGNTYNHESDLSDILQWSIMAPATDGKHKPELYAKGILLVQFHHGGDARGNYGVVKAYKWNGEDDFHFLEAVSGWYVTDLDGERIDDSLTQRFESGYSANPSNELSKHIVKILELSEDKATVELDNGLTVVLSPEHAANYR